MRVAISAASKGSATSSRVSVASDRPDEVAGVTHPVVGRERVGAGVRDEAQRVEPDDAVARTGARVRADDRRLGRERAVRHHLAQIRRAAQIGDLQRAGDAGHGEVRVAGEHGDHLAVVAHRDRLRAHAAPPGASAAPRRGRSGPRRPPGAAAGALRAVARRPTASSGWAVGPVVGRAWATHRKSRSARRAWPERDPEQEVGERHVGEQLPLGDDPLQVLDGAAGQLRVVSEQLAQRGHFTASPAPVVTYPTTCDHGTRSSGRRKIMSKRARKRRDRNKKSANHGKKPNT